MSKKKTRKAAAMALKSMAGRQDWNGIKPVTRVVPNKKRALPTRKAKHKGRQFDAGLHFFRAMDFKTRRPHRAFATTGLHGG